MRLLVPLALVVTACVGDGVPYDPAAEGGAGAGATGAVGSGAGAGAGAGTGAGGEPVLPSGWSTLAPIAGGPRQENAVVALAGEIYVLGGFDAQAQVVASVEAYNPGTDSWRGRAPLPAARHHLNAAVVDGKLYVLGSLAGLDFAAQPESHVYDPVADSWSEVAPMPPGSERGSAAVGVLGSKIYLAGGLRGGSVADFSAYDTVAGTWEALPALPLLRDHLVGAVRDGRFYVIAGRTNGIEAVTDRVDVFDPAAGSWSSAGPIPTARGGCMAALLGDGIFVFGGEGTVAVESGVFDDVEAFDAAGSWAVLPPMLTPRHGTGAAALGGAIFIPGGATSAGFGAVDITEAYVP